MKRLMFVVVAVLMFAGALFAADPNIADPNIVVVGNSTGAGILNWLGGNIVALMLIITTLYSVAGMIANLTPTKKDDEFVASIGNIINTVARALKLDFKK